MRDLDDILRAATRAIGAPYINLPIYQGVPVYRERVYCYELYHQMRARWPRGTPYLLNGELDKAGHEHLRGLGVSAVKPDLLVHRPGHMDHNHAVIEVKAAPPGPDGALKDLQTLSTMMTHANYERGIYLIYRPWPNWQPALLQAARAAEPAARIEVWHHEQADVPAVRRADIIPGPALVFPPD